MNDAFIHSEDDFLALINRYFPNEHKELSIARGDDCAVFACPPSLCVTTDLFVEDVHFRTSYFAPADIGHKALAVNVSDLAAMGAVPLGFSLALVAPRGVPVSFWEPFLQGMAHLAATHDLVLTGGDLSDGDKITVGITVWGAPGQRVLARGRTRIGDVLFVIGRVGMARVGLGVLEAGQDLDAFPACIRQHVHPEPLVEQGRLLAALPGVRGAMDISDGLEQDVPRLLAPGQGATMFMDPSVIHPEVTMYCARHHLNQARFCLRGGEDYALLGAVEPEYFEIVRERIPEAWKLGIVTANGFSLDGTGIRLQGFDHFSHEQP
ncbi:thiamine-phosphate kinase [Desulfoplanes formicivorans]|uniref:Thiamine-monophosphate kinase n=1 Tax=Desulfoplanes formicivorans TaxID=1592317 RepID=A0A194AFQ7_9BACT|nr:thiamine-phosphate kinase [Desulfoplanes formicivorans]GAU08163.1 thiamine-monophosphate kinase [Desulfoplanes formicivorans]